MAETTGTVEYEREGAIGTITFNRVSAHNAMTIAMMEQLLASIEAANADPHVRVILVTGAGDRAFCAGGDFGELIPRVTNGELNLMIPDPTKRFFSDTYKPVVAAVNGICVGGGLEVLLGTDVRIASSTAVFGLPEVRWGQVPGGGAHVRLTQQIGWAPAMQLLLTGESIDADRALQLGLVGEVVAPQQVVPRAREVADLIAANSPIAVRTAKEIVLRVQGNESRFALENSLNLRLLAHPDALEGPAAFVERRKPNFNS